jgi:hypothetical protein
LVTVVFLTRSPLKLTSPPSTAFGEGALMLLR